MDDDDDEEEGESKSSSSSVPESPKSWNLQILPVVQNPNCKNEESESESKKVDLSLKLHNITKRNARQDMDETEFDDKSIFGQYESQQPQQQSPFPQQQFRDQGIPPQRPRILQSNMRFQPMSQQPPAPVRLHNPVPVSSQQQQMPDERQPPQHMSLMPESSVPEEDEEEVAAPAPKYKFNYDIPKDSFQSEVVNGQFSTFAKLPNNFESLIQSDTSFLDSMTEYPSEGGHHTGAESAPDSRSGSNPMDMSEFNSQFDNEDPGGSDASPASTPSPQPITMSQAIRSIHNRQFGSRSTPTHSAPANDDKVPAASRLRNRLFRRVRPPANVQNSNRNDQLQAAPPVHRYERRMDGDDADPYPGSSEQQFLKRLGDYEENRDEDQDEYTDQMPVKASSFHWHYGTTTTTTTPPPPPVAYPVRPQYTTPAPPPPDPSREIIAQVRVIKNGLTENIRRHGEISVKYLSEPAGPPPPQPPPTTTPPPYTTPPPPPPPQYTPPAAAQYVTPAPQPPQYNPPAPAYPTPAPVPQWYTTSAPPPQYPTPPPVPPQYATPAPPQPYNYQTIPPVPPLYARPTSPPAPPVTYSAPPPPQYTTPAPPAYWQQTPPPTTTTPAPYAWLDDSDNLPPSQLPKVVYAIMMMDKQKRGRRRVRPSHLTR